VLMNPKPALSSPFVLLVVAAAFVELGAGSV
jgi:hypothetical protein